MYFFEQHAVKKLLGLLGTADAPEAVGGEKDNRLEVLEYDDVCMMDTTTTDYNGRICLVKAPGDKGSFFRRPFIDGDTAIMCHITDGNELKKRGHTPEKRPLLSLPGRVRFRLLG